MSAALIIVNPFSGANFELPSVPSISKGVVLGAPKVSEVKVPSAAEDGRAKIRQVQAALLEQKRAEQEAKRAESARNVNPVRGQTSKKAVDAKESSYESLAKRATIDGPKVTKEAKKLKKEETIAEVKATFAEGEAKKALDEAKSKEIVKEKAEEAVVKLAKQEAVDEQLAKSAAKLAVEEKARAAQLAKAAADQEAVLKASEKEVETKNAAEILKKKQKEDAIGT